MSWLSIFRYFYLLGTVNALFFSILIFSKPHRSLPDNILGSWLIVLSLQLFMPFLYLYDLSNYYEYAGYEVTFYSLHPVFLYFYIRAITGKKPVFKKSGYIIGTVVIITASMLIFFLLPASERFKMIMGTETIPLVYLLFVIPVIVFFLYFFIKSYRMLKNYKKNILHVYSYRENVDLLWLRRIFVFFYGILVVTMFVDFVFYKLNISIALGDYFYFVELTFFIFFLGYWGYRQGTIFNYQNAENHKEPVSEKHKNNGQAQQHYSSAKVTELKTLMENQKPYLNPTLTIYELASMIDMPPHQLSKMIRTEFHTNFFEFVNNYRIEAFKKLLLSEKYRDFTILAIAFECGFNSKSAFNRIFKEETGYTPSEFKVLKTL